MPERGISKTQIPQVKIKKVTASTLLTPNDHNVLFGESQFTSQQITKAVEKYGSILHHEKEFLLENGFIEMTEDQTTLSKSISEEA